MAHSRRKLNRLKGWDLYNQTIKMYKKQPIIKKVDIEELKKQFSAPVPTKAVKVEKVAVVESDSVVAE